MTYPTKNTPTYTKPSRSDYVAGSAGKFDEGKFDVAKFDNPHNYTYYGIAPKNTTTYGQIPKS